MAEISVKNPQYVYQGKKKLTFFLLKYPGRWLRMTVECYKLQIKERK